MAELTRRIVGGESVRSLAADLRRRGVPAARAEGWQADAVRELVKRPRNAGLREHRGQIVTDVHGEPVPAAWPPIVDRDSWEAAHAILTDPARRVSPGNAPARLLSGLMVCGVCDGKVRSGGAKGGVPVYRCWTGQHVKRRVSLVDALVETYVLRLLQREQVAAPTADTSPPDVRGKADAVRVKLEALEDKYADGDLSRAAYLRNRHRLTTRLAELERTEVLARVPGPLEGVTPARWAALPPERRRAVVAHLVTVRLLPTVPGNSRHDPELVEITPKRRTP